ncbi:C-terminal helicase domain-containing protein [Burkholderia vietnamiensis]|uniref:C-terminal helicase domain-containing protein n=1 Tax=Burkholderia vietnamiensis TaxID=60552 RepID=UPI001CF1C16D|nr:C-terminal helicase domain-containing protein [Burkholderia vietnamiensis]MCA8231298.1 SWF/SNF helicase family protein [Burkholderia vietnamiensis]
MEGLEVLTDALGALVNDTTAHCFSKYQRLLEQLRSTEFCWQPSNAEDRLVIFSERIETLKWLQRQLATDLKLKAEEQLAVLHGGMSDTDQQELVERFGRKEDSLRVLLCSDVASEGLNLHYFCHRLVHFDLPWSLMLFQQRNGRVDRYGQKHQPKIVYLFTSTVNEKIRGDLRILEILQAKDEQAYQNLGDPSAFLNVFDPDKEEEKVSDFMADGMQPEAVEARLDQNAANDGMEEGSGDWLMRLFGGGADSLDSHVNDAATAPVHSSLDQINASTSLFQSDYHYAKTALTQLNQGQVLCDWTSHDEEQVIALTAPRDLQERLRQLPREVQAVNDHYSLCAIPKRMMDAIETARQARAEEETWPQQHYLWPQHPIMDWLGDRVLAHFGRHKAPLLQSHKLARDEQAFILMSLIPNRKGQPLLVEWQVACRTGNGNFVLESFDAFVERAGIRAGGLPNSGESAALQARQEQMQQALPSAVKSMHTFMVERQQTFSDDMQAKLQNTLAELERLQGRQMEQLSLDNKKKLDTVKQTHFERGSQKIHKVFDDYRRWVEDTLTTEPKPWIQVLAGVCHPQAAGA